MDDLIREIDARCQLIGTLIGTCCVWKRTAFCLTERRLEYSFMHHHPFCDRIKETCGLESCRKNDTDSIIHQLQNSGSKPFLHRCHAGACELVIPVCRTGRLLGCVLCGPFGTVDFLHPLLPPWRENLKTTLPRLTELLLSDLLERFYNRYPEYTQMDPRIETALNCIAANFSRKLLLKEAAAAVHLSPSRFSHLFKSACGIDFSSYLLNLRLSIAQDMLRQTEIAVSEIALLTGFSSQQHFAALFKKHLGKTPGQYRSGDL